jgi:hypothetical protein
MAAYTSKRLPLPRHESGVPLQRADLEFIGVRHDGPSYEGRIFLNAPEAGDRTPADPAEGFAGSFFIFGHTHCWGDPGHCDVPPGPLHSYDYRPPHQLVPHRMVVEVTDAIQTLLEGRARSFTVTVVPLVWDEGEQKEAKSALAFERLSLVTYD